MTDIADHTEHHSRLPATPGSPPPPSAPTPEPEWSGPKRAAAPYYTGRRRQRADVDAWGNGAVVGIRDKGARRIMRKRITRGLSTIEMAIVTARKVRLEGERLASNSHEARRFGAAATQEYTAFNKRDRAETARLAAERRSKQREAIAKALAK